MSANDGLDGPVLVVSSAPEDGRRLFESPGAALAALVEICRTHAESAIAATFGTAWAPLPVTPVSYTHPRAHETP